MNIAKLKEAEERFFKRYPGGFSNPLMLEIAKKHRVEKMNSMAQESFSEEQFDNPAGIVSSMSKIISQSSLVSIFEKPKFRDLAKAMDESEKAYFSQGLKEFFYGDQKSGFEMMTGMLKHYQLAKWPLLTVCPVYFRPAMEVFVKPTTVKGIIEYFGLEGLKYSPGPTFEFYKAYREQILQMKKEVDPSFQNDNAGFCGFLMISMENQS